MYWINNVMQESLLCKKGYKIDLICFKSVSGFLLKEHLIF